MNTKIALAVVAALVVAGGGYYWYMQAPADAGSPQQTDTASAGKLNITIVCEGALAYMTFPDGASADKFVAECKAGEHPEVIERYKADHGFGDSAAI